jgi:hypothetical protein
VGVYHEDEQYPQVQAQEVEYEAEAEQRVVAEESVHNTIIQDNSTEHNIRAMQEKFGQFGCFTYYIKQCKNTCKGKH